MLSHFKSSSNLVNYEEYLASNLASIDNDLTAVLLFPTDDIRVTEIEKQFSTIEQLKPELEAEVDQNVNDCLRSYNSNYRRIVKNYAKYSSTYLIDHKKHLLTKTAKKCELQEFGSELPAQEQERVEFDENISNLNEESPNLLDGLHKENDQITNKQRTSSLFNFYPNQQQTENLNVEYKLIPNPPIDHICNRILVKCTQLKFELEIEPVWATMCLYDLKEKRKISENFAFDLNPDTIKQMLHIHQTHQDQSTLARSCIFNVTYPSADLFLVIRIEKVLQQGDISECVEPYMKIQSASGLEKLQVNANQFCERLGKYRMPFVWTAINIMSLLNNSVKSEMANQNGNPSNGQNLGNNNGNEAAQGLSLDRRFVKSLNETREDRNTFESEAYESSEEYNGEYHDESNAANKSGSNVIKSAFRKSSNESNNKRNSLVNCKTNGLPSESGLCTKANSFNGSLHGTKINNPQHDDFQNSLSNRLNCFKPIVITVNTFFKQESDKLSDEDLFRCLNDLKKQTNLVKKLKCVPGYLKMEFSPINHDPTYSHSGNTNLANNYILTPELQLYKLNLMQNEKNDSDNHKLQNLGHYHQPLLMHKHLLPIKDVLEFPSQPVYEANYLYRNLLYIYPGTINLCGASNLIRSGASSTLTSGIGLNQSSLGSSIGSSARNIAIKINLMRGEEEHCALPVLFAKSSSTLEYCKEVFINVVYHNKNPQYHDEVKIKLPALLNGATYHLLFTFYHVSCQNSKDQNQLESIIGYSWLPIQQQFQYETTVQLNCDMQTSNQSGMPSSNQNQTLVDSNFSNSNSNSAGSTGNTSGNNQQHTSYANTNRCSMIKNGTYSLPICFEKLVSGYSNINYSVFNTNYLNTELKELNEIDVDSSLEMNNFHHGDHDQTNDLGENLVNVNTTINNINSSNLSNSNLTGSSAKSYFDVGLKLVSTIHTQDVYLERFITLADHLKNGSQSRVQRGQNGVYGNRFNGMNVAKQINEDAVETTFVKAIGEICFAESESLVKFLYVIFDKLLFFILSPNPNIRSKSLETISRIVLKITNLLQNQNDSHKRNRLLVQYINFTCNFPTHTPGLNEKPIQFHEQFLAEWLTLNNMAKQNRRLRDLLNATSWFRFDLLHKSIAIHLNTLTHCLTNKQTNQFKAYNSSRLSLNTFCMKNLSQKFISDLETLISQTTKELINLHTKQKNSSDLSAYLNCSLAFFLLDLMSIIDRGFVFKRIEFYFKETNKSLGQISNLIFQVKNGNSNSSKSCESFLSNFRVMHILQLDFLRILSSHEHFNALNLPIFFDQSKSCSSSSGHTQKKFIIDSNDYFNKHFLIGLVLRQMFKSLHSSFSNVQFKSVQILRNIIEANDTDTRLSGNRKARGQIAYMYMPFLNMFIHFIPLMAKKCKDQKNEDCEADASERKETNMENFNESMKLNEQIYDESLFSESNYGFDNRNDLSALFSSDSDFVETSLNLDEFDVDLDRNEFFCADELFNEDIIEPALEKSGKNLANSSLISGHSSGNGLKNLRKISQQITKLDQFQKKAKPGNHTQSTKSNGKLVQHKCINKAKPCCDFYNLRLNLILMQDEIFDCTSVFSVETTQDLLICFMWILKNMDKGLLFKIWKQWSCVKLKKLLVLFDLCISHFEFKSSVWSDFISSQTNDETKLKPDSPQLKASSANNSKLKLSKHYFATQQKFKAKSNFFKRAKFFKYSDPESEMFFYDLNDCVSGRKRLHDLSGKQETEDTLSYSDKLALEGNLSTECMLIISDSIELIIEIIQSHEQYEQLASQNSNFNQQQLTTRSLNVIFQSQNLLKNLTKLLFTALSVQQSTRVLANLFTIQRDLVHKFSDLLFEQDTEYCSEICTILLRHCTSQLAHVRAQSSASLYFLMRQNFEIGNNFSRVKIQLTMSLSHLVTGFSNGDQKLTLLSEFLNVNSMKHSLKLILNYADNDLELIESSFPSQVKDLIINLNTILTDTIKMREFLDDPEMIIDLMHRIANCYQSSPDMRLIWLQNMAQKHLEKQNLVEAGQCLVHAGALVAEYLSLIENRSYLPVGCASFRQVSINVLEESAISDDVIQSIQGICTGKYFSETGLIGLIEQAAVFLMHSQNYEVANQLYKILIPIYEHHRDIKKLSQVHSKLHDCFNKILLNGSRRLFGTYFRVGFYGYRFEEINGEEFIYKEPGITKLSEIAHRLENFYTEKFGEGCVEIMKDSNNVDKKMLDLVSKAYIQITYVEPYFDRWELQKCPTFFEKNYSLKRFLYSTPFTLEGKAHGALNEQYKRKTILTSERAFPYVKLRIPVIDKQQIILKPVEVAIEDLQKKIEELRTSTYQDPADPKILQMVLQGCVGTTVNQGPLEMALTFLQPTCTKQITQHHNKLRLCFKEFSRRCLEALMKNKSLIGSDQFEYQREMERNYKELKLRIDPLIENTIFKDNVSEKNL